MKRAHRSFFCVMLAAWVLSLWVLPADAQSAAEGRIVFVAFKDGQWDIFSVTSSGADLRQLTADGYEDDQPAYSPDGTRLAYTSRRNGNWDLYLLDLRTGEETRLTDHPAYDGAPAWHPDGRRLAFESYRAHDLDIWLIDVSAPAAPLNLTANSPAGEAAPAWRDDGETLFFSSWRAGSNDIWSLSLETQTWTQLTTGPTAETQPAWNAAGQTLAFTRKALGDEDIFVWPAGAAQPRQWSWLGSVGGAAFSPDGRAIAAVYQGYDGAQLVRLAAEAPLPRFLTEKTMLRAAVSWHPGPVNAGTRIDTLRTRDVSSLYLETLTPSSSPHGEPYDLVRLNDLKTGTPWLADTVDDSYQALRRRLRDEVGYDFLGEVSETLRPISFFSEASQYSSWHKSGRAVDSRFDLPGRRLQIVRQNIGGETYWRLLLRCEDQTGRCGRPTIANPWNYSAQARTVLAPEQGGVEGENLYGYYVDFTTLAEMYGWERIASFDDEDFSWTWHFKAFEYWHYQKVRDVDGRRLSWYQAMLDVYPRFEVEEYFTWQKMRAGGEDPYVIVLKGVPLPPAAARWWQKLVPE